MRTAYAATDYRVLNGEHWLGVRLGRSAPEIERLLARLGAASGTFVTAWNPLSELTADAANAAAAALLTAEIQAHGWRALPHRGVGDNEGWAAEEGWFVLDLDAGTAEALAERYRQNAIVRIERGKPAYLIETHWLAPDA